MSLTPVVADEKASVTVNGTSLVDGKATLSDLAVGDNLNIISVTAEDGTTRGYTLNIKRDICHPSKVELSTTNLQLKQGESSSISATVTPAEAQNKDVKWTSSNASIASVDENGKITAVSAGEATITATTVDNNVSSSCNVKVIPKSNNCNLTSLTLQTSDSSTITLSPSFETDNLNYNAFVNYSVSSIVLAPVVADETARVSVNGAALLTDKLTIPNLTVGNNLISIVVTAEDGTKKRIYCKCKKRCLPPY